MALEPSILGTNPGSVLYWLCDPQQLPCLSFFLYEMGADGYIVSFGGC